MAPDALFVYGSLLFPDVLRIVVGRVPDRSKAAAAGWQVVGLPGKPYPALIPASGTAEGELLTGITPSEWRALDAFEDSVYELRRISLVDGRYGWAYVCPDESTTVPDRWDAERFGVEELPAYLVRCAAWRRRYSGGHE